VGGTLTGEGGDILILDDPHNPQHIMSEKYRAKTISWFSNTFVSRLNDKKNGVIIIIMQRLHSRDLCGYLLDKNPDSWTLLSIPAIENEDKTYSIGNFTKFRSRGEILHPDREGRAEIEQIKLDMGSYIFAAQYQQKPITDEGNIIKDTWIKRYTTPTHYTKIFLSFDTGIKAGIKNDPTVCTVWGEREGNLYLLQVYRDWLEYPDLKRIAIDLIKTWAPHAILVEDKASGQSLLQDLRREIRYPLIPIKVSKDKITRLAAVSVMFESGKVFLPTEATWLPDYENELYSFPFCDHDDQVDSTTQFLEWYKNGTTGSREVRIRML